MSGFYLQSDLGRQGNKSQRHARQLVQTIYAMQCGNTVSDRAKVGSEKAAHVYAAKNNAEKVREIVMSVLKKF